MTLLDSSAEVAGAAPAPRESWLVRRLGQAWPLKVMLLGFPVWWALGLASFIALIVAGIMAVQLARRRTLRVPVGFGLWVLFLVWMLAGVFVLWAHAPGTVGGGGPERLIGYGYRVLWYLAVTVAMLYPLNVSHRAMPSKDVTRWLGVLFVYCVLGGLAGLFAPHFGFTSPMEMIIPGARTNEFLNAIVHPSLTTSSEFLGYDQPRPKAPFAYANAWGNNLGLLMPFFIYSGWADSRPWWRWLFPAVVGFGVAYLAAGNLLLGAAAFLLAWWVDLRRWPRMLVALGLGLAAVPVAYSLNRGLWLGVGLITVCGAVALLRTRRYTELWTLAVAVTLAAVFIVLSPLWATITLRLATPHSNERRLTVAQVVVDTTWQGSPLLGYGTTRKVEGNFESIAGGATANCHQCAAPPLGTQGFMWRLIFTTGFVGTALFLAFLAVQFLVHVRRREALCLLGCISLVTSGLFFFVYDSLETPLVILALAIGLMNRERILGESRDLADRANAALGSGGPIP